MTEALFPEAEAAERAEIAAAFARKEAIEARLREREADFTPRLVARAVVEAVLHAERGVTPGEDVYLAGSPYSVWPAVADVAGPDYLGGYLLDDDFYPFIELLGGRRRVIRVLDICAGAGVWSSEVRRIAALIGFEVHITAVDYEPDERQWLVRHADEVIIGPWQLALGMVREPRHVRTMTPSGVEIQVEEDVWVWGPNRREYDLIIGNPAFTQARAATRAGWPEASGPPGKNGRPTVTKPEASRRKHLADKMVAAGEYPERAEYDTTGSMPALCLECAPAVVLYASQQCYTKTSSGWLTRLDYPYAVVYEVPSSVGHRGRGEGQDDKPYAAFVWLRGRGEPSATFMLKPVEDRNWDVRPGTESDEWLEGQGIPFLRAA